MTECLKDSVYVADDMTTMREDKPSKSNYSKICCAFVKYALSNGSRSKRTDVVFEVDENNLIKYVKRNRCSN